MNRRIPTRLDRYPAKMVSRLADKLVSRYAVNAKNILDPFCGSGAGLAAGRRNGFPVTGIDLNPVAGLLSGIKLTGFSVDNATALANEFVQKARKIRQPFPIQWGSKN